MDNLTENDFDIRDVLDLLKLVYLKKEKFVENHPALISISEDFINYYIDNANDVFEIMHPLDIVTENKQEEVWDCVETGPMETHNSLTTTDQKEEAEEEYEWECLDKDSDDGFQEDISDDDYTLWLEVAKEECRVQKEEYIIGLWRQSESDLKAADLLQKNDCCSQAIFCYQQASEKALKALLLKREIGLGVHSDYFKSHYLDMLAERALTIQDKYDGNFELVKNARLFEAVGPIEKRKRSLCVRARYAVTSIGQEAQHTQPWFVFDSKDVLNASIYTLFIFNYCDQELGFENLTSPSDSISQ